MNDPTWEFVARRDSDDYLQDPRPWFTPGAAALLERTLKPGDKVFEWGSGASTSWFERLGCEVLSYETDPRWLKAVSARLGPRSEVELVEPGSESYFPDVSSYDLVVIDGERRSDCARHVLRSSYKGIVVFDDVHQPAFAEAAWDLGDAATRSRHFAGVSAQFGPKLTSIYWF